jgi:hypothetical protein
VVAQLVTPVELVNPLTQALLRVVFPVVFPGVGVGWWGW